MFTETAFWTRRSSTRHSVCLLLLKRPLFSAIARFRSSPASEQPFHGLRRYSGCVEPLFWSGSSAGNWLDRTHNSHQVVGEFLRGLCQNSLGRMGRERERGWGKGGRVKTLRNTYRRTVAVRMNSPPRFSTVLALTFLFKTINNRHVVFVFEVILWNMVTVWLPRRVL